MKYLLLPHADEDAWLARTRAQQDETIAAFAAYGRELREAGALVAAHRPMPSSAAKTVRVTDAGPRIVDGPHLDTRMQLSGVYIIDAPDLDAAVSWALRNPAAAFGLVEVRPIQAPRS